MRKCVLGPELTWRQYMCHLTNQPDNIFYDNLRVILADRFESLSSTLPFKCRHCCPPRKIACYLTLIQKWFGSLIKQIPPYSESSRSVFSRRVKCRLICDVFIRSY
jgi:hypothetical protein